MIHVRDAWLIDGWMEIIGKPTQIAKQKVKDDANNGFRWKPKYRIGT